jgi:hypothetical protein
LISITVASRTSATAQARDYTWLNTWLERFL